VTTIIGFLIFALGGAAAGAITAWSLDFRSRKELIQGAAGGLIVGLGMALLLPM
jgi:threonine/homoserine/homoserine lactone efflux protein